MSQGLTEQQIAQQSKEKFDFYFLSLIFTMLVLTIQTGKFGRSIPEDVLELIGWASFIVSGLFGLWRMEWEPLIRVQMARKQDLETSLADLHRMQTAGQQAVRVHPTNQQEPIGAHITKREKAIEFLANDLKSGERAHEIKYRVSRYSFVLGILAVAVSRSLAGIAYIFNAG